MIRVLQVLGGLNRGGAETMVMNLYRALDHKEIHFDFIIHSYTQNDYREEIENLGGRIFVFPTFKAYNAIQYRNKWNRFLNEHTEYKIVHSHVRSYASVFFPIAQKHGLKTIVHSHSTSNGFGIKSQIKNLLQKPLAKQSDYLFACSGISGKWLYGEKGVKQDNYYLVKNSIDVEKYRFDLNIRKCYRRDLAIENKIVFGHVGRLSEPKNHRFLLEVFMEIVRKENNAVLIIVGDGELKKIIQNQIEELCLQDNVYMLGSRNDVAEILQAVDVFLFPSLWEGLPVTVVEAQAAGLPCIISDTITEEVKLSPNVIYLPINKGTKIWTENALKMINSRYPESADLVVSAGFDVQTTAKWLTDFYRGLINE